MTELSRTLDAMRERCYYTYIVASRTHILYIGVTGNIERRIAQHKSRATPGFTAKYNCDRLVWFERHSLPSDAIAREKELKGWIRTRKLALIERDNPTWIDLSENWGKSIPRPTQIL
ncbi:MAG: GIY-YIG nuclease family protein [Acidobacteriaceae bacterium]